jgi:DNA polymerase V
MFALVDCNNFYVSCERVFNPALKNRAVVVLSNNDGCVVARSNEVKDARIPMGAPLFKIKDQLDSLNCAIFSSNYSLYGDMSNRVMTTLSYYSDKIEYYSIDEAFLEFPDYSEEELISLGHDIVKRVTQHTGIPVSVGFGPTKTLAKLANEYAKKDGRKANTYKSCYVISDEINAIPPKSMAVDEIWGIGFRYSKLLKSMNINTVDDFCKMDPSWVKSKLTIQGLTTQHELNFRKLIDLEMITDPQKNIISSRSFGKAVTTKEGIQEAVANHVANATAKIRKRGLAAYILRVLIMTDRFKESESFWSASCVLDVPTNNTIQVMHKAMALVDKLYDPTKKYKKAGIMLLDLIPTSDLHPNLFDQPQDPKIERMFNTVDRLNGIYGKNHVRILRQGVDQHKPIGWQLKANLRSPRYSTRWGDMLVIRDK